MGKSKNFKIILEQKQPRKFHCEHRSGAGTHDNRPKRERTRAKQKEKWSEEYE